MQHKFLFVFSLYYIMFERFDVIENYFVIIKFKEGRK